MLCVPPLQLHVLQGHKCCTVWFLSSKTWSVVLLDIPHPLVMAAVISLSLLLCSLNVECGQIADKLFSSFGQDILDSLFWTAAEARGRRRERVGVLPHLALAVVYVCILTAAVPLLLISVVVVDVVVAVSVLLNKFLNVICLRDYQRDFC